MYADDICLMAPSPVALQELIDICFTFNSAKTFCMFFKPRLYKLFCPTLYMGKVQLDYVDNAKYMYLGFTFCSSKSDDADMIR